MNNWRISDIFLEKHRFLEFLECKIESNSEFIEIMAYIEFLIKIDEFNIIIYDESFLFIKLFIKIYNKNKLVILRSHACNNPESLINAAINNNKILIIEDVNSETLTYIEPYLKSKKTQENQKNKKNSENDENNLKNQINIKEKMKKQRKTEKFEENIENQQNNNENFRVLFINHKENPLLYDYSNLLKICLTLNDYDIFSETLIDLFSITSHETIREKLLSDYRKDIEFKENQWSSLEYLLKNLERIEIINPESVSNFQIALDEFRENYKNHVKNQDFFEKIEDFWQLLGNELLNIGCEYDKLIKVLWKIKENLRKIKLEGYSEGYLMEIIRITAKIVKLESYQNVKFEIFYHFFRNY